jgi:glyoxylase-like metal-dependent hydrolase (beta-lactamase superfamily II)
MNQAAHLSTVALALRPHRLLWLGLVLFLSSCLAGLAAARPTPAGKFSQPDPLRCPDLFAWTDTCKVYVLRDGDSALLIDLGDGSVLDHLSELGVKRIEWVLFTHHHREQCQGYPRLQSWNVKIGAPEAERALFERPTSFRKMKVSLDDAFTVYGSSYVRPPVAPIPVDRAFRRMDTFTWHGHEFWCVDTRGNSPGAMSYLLRRGKDWLAFTGDLMLDGATLHTWFDTEWDYGFGAGIWAIANSASQVAGYRPLWLLPSHGPPIHRPARQLAEYQRKLVRLERLLVRGYPVSTFASAIQDPLSQPSRIPHVWQTLPHVFKFRGPNFFPNFYLILADSGHALVVDCGLLEEQQLEAALQGMRRELGLKQIDALIITHMHGDHFLQAPYLREKWGAAIWGLDRMAPVCEHPEWFDCAAPIQAYGDGFPGIRLDRSFRAGETFDWEGYRLTVDWMPGQTEFALCLQGVIDGRKVAFTGDNLFGDPADPTQTGHEAVVAHNSAILEEGYIYAAEYLRRLKPDLLLGGHSYVMDQPAKFIERYRRWAYDMRRAFRELLSHEDYRYGFDPFWVRAEPYRFQLRRGETFTTSLHLRNFLPREQEITVKVHTPQGLTAPSTATLPARLKPEARTQLPLQIQAAPDAPLGVRIVALDVTLDGKRLGEWFDCVVEVVP